MSARCPGPPLTGASPHFEPDTSARPGATGLGHGLERTGSSGLSTPAASKRYVALAGAVNTTAKSDVPAPSQFESYKVEPSHRPPVRGERHGHHDLGCTALGVVRALRCSIRFQGTNAIDQATIAGPGAITGRDVADQTTGTLGCRGRSDHSLHRRWPPRAGDAVIAGACRTAALPLRATIIDRAIAGVVTRTVRQAPSIRQPLQCSRLGSRRVCHIHRPRIRNRRRAAPRHSGSHQCTVSFHRETRNDIQLGSASQPVAAREDRAR